VSTDYDAVIVGARVAGAATALHLARAGRRVLVVDRTAPTQDTLSTHALMRTAVLQLQRAGLLDRLAAVTPPIRRLTLAFGGEPFSFDVRADHGVDTLYGPRRTVLDPLILDAAVEAGAEVELGKSVTGLVHDGADRVAGVRLGDTTIRAAFVVGADGLRSTVARLTGAVDRRVVVPTAASVYTYYSGMPDPGFDFRYAPRATAGALRTNDDLTLVWAGVPVRDMGDPADTFASTLTRVAPDLAAAAGDGVREERFRFTPGIRSFLREATGPGWLLVGDAGFTKDPLSAHGISCALRDAEFAAEAIDGAIGSPADERRLGQRYESLRDRFAVPLLEETAALASYDWTLDEASALMRRLGRLTDLECEYLRGRESERLVA
jgi:menaquinone-9 beta-reductase